MITETAFSRGHDDPTQLTEIRDFMLEASAQGAWLTLAEIAAPTEYGEASISAQLRHLRKARHGRYRVMKRRRRAGESEVGRDVGLWEYQVLPPREAPSRSEIFPAHEPLPAHEALPSREESASQEALPAQEALAEPEMLPTEPISPLLEAPPQAGGVDAQACD